MLHLIDHCGVAAPAVPAGPAGAACLQGRFHDGCGFVKVSFLVSWLWLCNSKFCPNLDFLAKTPQLTHDPISDKCQQPAMGAQTGAGVVAPWLQTWPW